MICKDSTYMDDSGTNGTGMVDNGRNGTDDVRPGKNRCASVLAS